MTDKELTLDELAEKAKNIKDNIAETKKSNYQLARELGFTSYEAIALQHTNKETIRRLAQERKEVQSK